MRFTDHNGVATSGQTQANASAHLCCLWHCGLVAREPKGREASHYRLVNGVEVLLAAGSVNFHILSLFQERGWRAADVGEEGACVLAEVEGAREPRHRRPRRVPRLEQRRLRDRT